MSKTTIMPTAIGGQEDGRRSACGFVGAGKADKQVAQPIAKDNLLGDRPILSSWSYAALKKGRCGQLLHG